MASLLSLLFNDVVRHAFVAGAGIKEGEQVPPDVEASFLEYDPPENIQRGYQMIPAVLDTFEDYKKQQNELVRELDVALNDDRAAPQATLADIVQQVKHQNIKAPVNFTPTEVSVLKMLSGIESPEWGAAVNQALESLKGNGFVEAGTWNGSSAYRLTDKGQNWLDHHRLSP